MTDDVQTNTLTINILSVQISNLGEEQRDFTLQVGDDTFQIPVNKDIFAHYANQFKTNTNDQKKRRATLVNLMRAAYLQGVRDGKAAAGAS